MAIARELAGYTPRRRRPAAPGDGQEEARGPGRPSGSKFHAGMRDNGYSEEAIKALWDVMLPFSGYAFNKSHTAGYGLVSYWTAYLKANYPAEYMAALLTSVGDDKDKAAIYLADARKMGIQVLPPDVNESRRGLRRRRRRRPLRAAVGAQRRRRTSSRRSSRPARARASSPPSPTSSTRSTCPRCNKRAVESLIKAGAFDSLGHTRKGLIADPRARPSTRSSR